MAATLAAMLALTVLWTAPALLGLDPATYRFMTLARYGAVLLALPVLAALGRVRRRRPVRAGLAAGFTGGLAGGLFSSFLIHLPRAEAAFAAQLPEVPPAAALAMLNVHRLASAVITALMAGAAGALLGAWAAWWGGRYGGPRRPPEGLAEEPPARESSR